MKPVKIAWNKCATVPITSDFSEALNFTDYTALTEKAELAPNPSFELSPEIFVEIPPSDWGHGDVLIYLPKRGWLVRRNYKDYWYIDLGIFKKIEGDLYGWTDLWLDVIAPKSASTYQVLDADEFGVALKTGNVSIELAAFAMDNFHHLVEVMHKGSFPIPEVKKAEEFFFEHYSKDL